jgi:hypothetical protein
MVTCACAALGGVLIPSVGGWTGWFGYINFSGGLHVAYRSAERAPHIFAAVASIGISPPLSLGSSCTETGLIDFVLVFKFIQYRIVGSA